MKLKKYLFVVTLFVCCNAFSQPKDLLLPDSLTLKLQQNSKEDIARVKALNEVVDYLTKQSEFTYREIKDDPCFLYIKEIRELSEKLGYHYGLVLYNFQSGALNFYKSNFLQAIKYLIAAKNRLSTLPENPETQLMLVRIQASLNACYAECNMFPESYEAGMEGLKANEKVGNQTLNFAIKNNLAAIYMNTNRKKEAISIMYDLLNNSSLQKRDRYLSYRNLVISYLELHELDSASICIDSAYQYIEYPVSPTYLIYLRGCIYAEKKDYELAEKYYEEAFNAEDISRRTKASILIDWAYAEYSRKRYTAAVDFAQSAIGLGIELRDYVQQKNALEIKMNALTELERYRDAIKCFDEYKSVTDSLESFRNKERLDQLILQKEIKSVEEQAKIELLKQQYEHERLQTKIYIILLISLVVVMIVLWLYRRKITLLKHRKKELDLRNRELTSNVLSQIQKNELLTDVVKRLKELKNDAEEASAENIHAIIHDLEQTQSNDAKKDFDYYFVQVHPDFYSKLKTDYPGLTPYELRLCAFLKLNLSSKEIATINNIALESVKSARKRLRKTLKISESGDSFALFFSKY